MRPASDFDERCFRLSRQAPGFRHQDD
jgi:hypothetical protein